MSQKMAISCILDLMSKDSVYYPIFARYKANARFLVVSEECIILSDDKYEALYIYAEDLENLLKYIDDIDFYYFKTVYCFKEEIAYYIECLHKYEQAIKLKVHTYVKEDIECEELTLTPLDDSYLGMLRGYSSLSDEQLQNRIDNKTIFGYFVDDDLAALISYREDGLIDIFHIFKAYCGQGLDYLLEANIVKKILSNKLIPYTFTADKNNHKLQDRLGFMASNNYLLMSYVQE